MLLSILSEASFLYIHADKKKPGNVPSRKESKIESSSPRYRRCNMKSARTAAKHMPRVTLWRRFIETPALRPLSKQDRSFHAHHINSVDDPSGKALCKCQINSIFVQVAIEYELHGRKGYCAASAALEPKNGHLCTPAAHVKYLSGRWKPQSWQWSGGARTLLPLLLTRMPLLGITRAPQQ